MILGLHQGQPRRQRSDEKCSANDRHLVFRQIPLEVFSALGPDNGPQHPQSSNDAGDGGDGQSYNPTVMGKQNNCQCGHHPPCHSQGVDHKLHPTLLQWGFRRYWRGRQFCTAWSPWSGARLRPPSRCKALSSLLWEINGLWEFQIMFLAIQEKGMRNRVSVRMNRIPLIITMALNF